MYGVASTEVITDMVITLNDGAEQAIGDEEVAGVELLTTLDFSGDSDMLVGLYGNTNQDTGELVSLGLLTNTCYGTYRGRRDGFGAGDWDTLRWVIAISAAVFFFGGTCLCLNCLYRFLKNRGQLQMFNRGRAPA